MDLASQSKVTLQLGWDISSEDILNLGSCHQSAKTCIFMCLYICNSIRGNVEMPTHQVIT